MRCRACRVVVLLVMYSLLTAPLVGQPATITWSMAITPLAATRSQAEVCVKVLKGFGTEMEIARGQLVYGKAKAESDAIIEGLITALATGEAPGGLPGLQARVSSSISGLAQF